MGMNKPDVEGQNHTWNHSISKTDDCRPELATYPTSSSENSTTSYDDNNDIIEFGPIKVKPRKKPAPTLATGRRSKYEVLSPDEEQKRDIRRARNRAAAERVRISRLNIEQQLQYAIDALEDDEKKLLNNVQILQQQKLQLQSRIFTHEKMCSTITETNLQNNLMPVFNPSTFQQLGQISDINLDELFLHSPPRLQNDYSDSLTTMTTDDIDDFLMNP